MRRRLGDSIVIGVLGFLLIFSYVVCSARPAPPESRAEIEYANAYKKLMLAYRDSGLKLVSAPLPSKSMPKAQQRAAYIKQVQDIADMNHHYAQRLNRLRPPISLQEVHATTEHFFKVAELGNL